jgi:putative hydrolase of the HAD superfamily
LKYSGLDIYFKEVITSEGSNSLKPQKEIFEFAFQKAGAKRSDSIMIGDTIDVDILGAVNAGIDQVHVNHLTKEPVPVIDNKLPTYTVYSLKELEKVF